MRKQSIIITESMMNVLKQKLSDLNDFNNSLWTELNKNWLIGKNRPAEIKQELDGVDWVEIKKHVSVRYKKLLIASVGW